MRSDTAMIAVTAEDALRLELASSEAELLDLKEPWTDLIAEVPQASIFLTWEWVTTWWKYHGQGKSLWILLAWNGDGRLVGLAPWMLERDHLGPVVVRRLCFPGSRFAFRVHQDILARPSDAARVCTAFQQYLEEHRGKWDLFDLEGLVQDSAFRACLPAVGGRQLDLGEIVCPYAALPDSWETYEKTALSANRRQQVRSRRRHLERDHPGQVEFQQVRSIPELESTMKAMIGFNQRRWHEKGIVTSFDDAQFLAFHRELAATMLAKDWLRFYVLRVGEQVIAAEYCFRFRNVMYNYQRGFDLDWDKYSPGQVLLAHVIREAISEGVCEFDMLRGEHDYKFSWATDVRSDSYIVLSSSINGHSWLTGVHLLQKAKSVGRQVLPKNVRDRVNGFISRSRH